MDGQSPKETAWLIIGASGHSRSLAAIIRGRGERIAALSDRAFGTAGARPDGPVPDLAAFAGRDGETPACFGDDGEALDYAARHSLAIAVGIGDNAIRSKIADAILGEARFAALAAPLVASSATVDSTAVLGALSQVCEHAHVGPQARIGDAAVINTSAVVEHDAVVGAGTHIAPGAVLLGAAVTGIQVFLGSGARILPGVSVGDFAVLGAGSVATRPLAGMTTYVGVPAQRLVSTKGPAN
jgi:sugar O-acyltransferase (sialic acid O-acetyltransferase NeuD family)